MTLDELLTELNRKHITLSVEDDDLVVVGKEQALDDGSLLTHLRNNKRALIEVIAAGTYGGASRADDYVPPNRIPPMCEIITPEMLTLIRLDEKDIDRIVGTVPGGAANVQDIYPLAPLQEGLLFQHLLDTEGDNYITRHVVAFDNSQHLKVFLSALQRVVDRHDILRTAILWDGLPQPVQVVYRNAPLLIQKVALNTDSDALEQLMSRTDSHHLRIDLQRAPLLAAHAAHRPESDEWLLALLNHHLVCDHVTNDIILAEIQTLLRGQDHLLPPPVPYRNFIAQARAVPAAEHEAYFRAQLGDVEEPTAPFGLGYVQADQHGLKDARSYLSKDLARDIRRTARQQGVTAAVLFHVAWALVAARCSGRNDVVFGTVLLGRMRGTEGLNRVLGMFINTLPLRIPLANRTVHAVVIDTYQRLSELLIHEQASLALAQRCSGIRAPMPLFTSLLNYRHSRAPTAEAHTTADTEREGMRSLLVEQRTHYPLDVSVDDLGRDFCITSKCAYGVDPNRMVAYLRTAMESLVTALAQAPQSPVLSLSILPAAERQQLLVEWNATEAPYTRQLIHQLFEAQAAAHPEAPALRYQDQSLTYGQLNAKANQLAHYLLALGIRPDDPVAICLERSPDMVVGLLGILKAGGAYVPLDPGYPAERLAYLLGDSRPRVVLTQEQQRRKIPATAAHVIVLDQDWPRIARLAASNPDVGDLRPDHLLYVIYTSGSTGVPKAAQVTHHGFGNLLSWYIEDVRLARHDAVLLVTSQSFDLTQKNIFGPLMVGGVLSLATEPFDPRSILSQIERESITHINLAPSAFHALIDADTEGKLRSLRRVVLGGEPVQVNKLLTLREPRPQFINSYGPTECSDVVACHVLSDDLAGYASQGVPLGKPTRNTRLYVLDSVLQPVPIGAVGEICIAGVQLGRGYLNRPQLTAERFLPDPFGPPGTRLYRTGDLGRWRPDGCIDFLGRNDFQVKIRGFRIELGEIEAQLLACRGVREAVVITREGETYTSNSGDKRLVAYLVPEEDAELSIARLRAQLASVLAEYMLPAAYVTLPSLPLTPNGKLDRRALPAPEAEAYFKRAYEAPTGKIEVAIAGIWQDLLHVEHIGRHDHFFELGGHSLLAMQLISRLRQVLGADVAVRDLFATPTLSALAKRVAAATALVLPPIQLADRTWNLPLSWAQQRLWFLAQLDPAASAAYHLPAALRLRGVLDSVALSAALDRVVARHEILRTTFVKTDNSKPVQVIAPANLGFNLARHDLRNLPALEQEAAIARLNAEEAHRPFDLAAGPLIRGQLLQLAPDDHVLFITQHHIVSDAWSQRILIKEIAALYSAFSHGQTDPLPPLPIQYADYALWQRQWLQGEALQTQIEFWRNHLAGAPTLLELPTDHLRPSVQRYAGGTVPLAFSSDLTARLRAMSQRHGMTLFMTLLAGWSILLARSSGQNDLVIGTTVANRQRTEIESLLGFFVNTLALRIELGDVSVAELLRRVKALTLDAYAHQDVPFEQVVEALQPVRSLSHSPIFQVLFALDNTPAADTPPLPGLQLAPITTLRSTTQFDLLLSLADTGEAIKGDLGFASALFERPSIERIVGHFQALLSAMVADDSQRIRELPLLSPDERHQLLVEWNGAREPCSEQLIHQLFELQAARQPSATAVVYQDQSLTYGELNTKANQLAHYLLSLGIRPDDRVALCVERSPDMLVSLLGILKVGAAYVPLDPNSPEARLAFMLTDCAPVALLTQATLAERLPAMSMLRVLILDDSSTQAVIASHPSDNLEPGAVGLTASHLAYVIYTSGSTGRPKGVMVGHGGLTHYVQWAQRHYLSTTLADSRADSIVASPLAFDATITSLYAPLISGGSVTLIPEGEELTGLTALLRQPRSWALMKITPAHLAVLAKTLHADGTSCEVRCVVVGGEALPSATVALWQAICPSGRLINEYGPTETVVGCSVYEASQSSAASDDVPIGRPIANMTMYLLDTHRQPVPIGVTGEIYIGGVQVARGYLNRPDLTEERFLPDPFSTTPHARMYKTGDLARYLPDGNLMFLGRNDFQVKIRGFRIELGEIEAQLLTCRGVRAAVVIARDDTPVDKRLVAYLVPDEGAELSVDELRTQLAATLAEYMVPAAYVTLPSLPLTLNGKLDRQALPAPEGNAYLKRAYEAPIGELEIAIAGIWHDLLHVERVGRHDHFFELGGHSLLVVTFIERLHHLSLTADVRSVFANPTVAAIAAVIAEGKNGTPAAVTPPNLIPADSASVNAITPDMLPLVSLTQADIDRITAMVPQGIANIQDVYPLAPLQEGILFHHLLEADSDPYLSRVILAFENRCRLDAFLDALQRVVNRHDILRTAVLWAGLPQPVQVVYRNAPLPIRELQVGADDDALETLLSRTDPQHTRLDLQQAPLMSLHVARNPRSDEWLLALLNHHMVLDHITLDLVLEEIQTLGQGHGECLPPVVPYRNFVAQARAISATEHEVYFRAQLVDVDEPTAPFGLLDVQNNSEPMQEAVLPLSDDLATSIREQASRLGVSAAVLFHVAWAQVVAHCSGRDDVVFGTVLLGRLQGTQGVNRALGMFINTLPLRIPLTNRTARAVVDDTYKRLSELLVHEQASLALAQHCSGVRAPLPLFTSFLNYRHSHNVTTADNGAPGPVLDGMRALAFEQRTNYPISLSVDDRGEGFSLKAQCVRGADPARMTAYLRNAVESLVTALAAESQQPLLSLSILSAAERRQLLMEWNATGTPHSNDRLIHQVFEAQAAARPDAPALMYEDQSLTYGELNVKANQLAHHLLSLGIRPEDPVALCIEPGTDMVVGLLGILKAGGIYVPLDPDYPSERSGFMLADCAPRAVLTQTALKDRLPALTVPAIELDDRTVQAALARHSRTDPDPAALGLTSQHLAYVIYTSGSSGRPKGVMVEHRHLAASTLARTTSAVSYDRFLLLSSIAFDSSIAGIFGTLSTGGGLVLVSRSSVQDPQALGQAILKYKITALLCVPSLAQLVVDHLKHTPPSYLQTIIVAGESCSPTLRDKITAFAPQIALYNEYGPTEATVWATAYRCNPDDKGPIPIGRPIANTRIYLLDAHRQPAPIGVTGEIYIGGVQVARGYLNRPDLTQERFLPDPFSAAPQARMYKTGDLARYLPDGNLVFLGRNDLQVKIRGFRIELGEIEAQLHACRGVRESVVIAREDTRGESRLVAYLVLDEGAEVSVGELRTQLASALAEHMVPAAYVTLPSLPLTHNGKLDRRALPAPGEDAYTKHSYKAPVGEIEATIASIWQDLFHVAKIGRQDHFFELGGHSLLAVQFVSRLRQALGIDIALRELFAEPTVAGFAAALVNGNKQLLHRNLAAIRPQGSLNPLFLIHPGGGEVAYARALAPSLDPELPIYGLAASGLLEGEAPLRTVEAMAEHYIQAIRQIRPRGPYNLAGYSSGGTIAYEMANQLIGADETVAFLGLIGTSYTEGATATQPQFADEAAYLLQRCEAGIAARAASPILGELRMLANAGNLDALLVRCQEAGLIPGDIDQHALRRYLALYMATDEALARYTLPPIPVPLSLFVTTQGPEGRHNTHVLAVDAQNTGSVDPGRLLGWKQLAGERLRVIPVGGNHLTMIEPPHVQHLGTAIMKALTEAGNETVTYPEFSYSPVVAVHSGDSDLCPLFCIPGAGASVTAFCALAEALETTRPVYGLQPRGLHDSLVPHIDVPGAARAYLSAIRAVCPRGPYKLLGHSFGGWIALEMARQLTSSGKRVSALIILDSEAPMSDANTRTRLARVPLLLKLVELFELSSQRSLALTAADLAPLDHDRQLELLLERMIAAQIMPSNTNIQVLRGMVRVFAANSNTSYVPEGFYDGPLHFVEATAMNTEAVASTRDAQAVITGWRRWAPGTISWRCPGNHMTMLAPPHAAALAQWLRPLLVS